MLASLLVSAPQTAFRLTHARGEVSVIYNLIARRKVPIQSDTKKEKGNVSEDLRLLPCCHILGSV